MSMKNSNDTIWNRTRDCPTRSAVPQPTAPPAACPLPPLNSAAQYFYKNCYLNVIYTCIGVTEWNKRVIRVSRLTSAREKHDDSTSDDAVLICLRHVLGYLLVVNNLVILWRTKHYETKKGLKLHLTLGIFTTSLLLFVTVVTADLKGCSLSTSFSFLLWRL